MVPEPLTNLRRWRDTGLDGHAWPFRKSGPWDPAAVRAWRDEIRAQSPHPAADAGLGAGLTPERKADLAWRYQRARKEKRINDVADSLLHRTDLCREARLKQLYELKRRLTGIPQAVAAGLVGKTAEEIAAELRARIDQALNEFAAAIPAAPPAPPQSPTSEVPTHEAANAAP